MKFGLMASVSALTLTAGAARAQEAAPATVDDIVVTGTLRGASTVQDAPINISAIGERQIEQLGVTDLAQISRYVPGLYVVDQGPRNANRIVVRGLNIDPLGESVSQGAGGTVATYLGEAPIAIDLKLNDVERVEFLLGPQGTLYGAGTLGGAIRYIPNAPDFSEASITVRGDAYGYSEGDGVSTDFGFTANLPISDTLAFRVNLDQLNDKGFIDQPYLVRDIGVSLANDFSSPEAIAANMYGKEDVNTEDVLSGRAALRWRPNDRFDFTLSYNYQNSDVGGRQVSGRRVDSFPVEVGEYDAIQRVEEPNERTSDLWALEAKIDLGWADLISATAYQTFEEDGRRDQTDLLISLGYSYEAFPSFTAYTQELEDNDTFSQEVRLTSKPGGGPLSWIVGGYYSKEDYWNSSAEYTPGFDQFVVDNWGGVQLRPDSLEYYSVSYGEVTETALFGELTWEILPGWQVTGGARRYTYELETNSATDLPLLETVFYGRDPASIVLDAPISFAGGPNGQRWSPENYSREYYGPQTLRRGLELSRNVMTVRLAQQVGMKRIVEQSERMGLPGLTPNLSVSLGAGEVTPYDITAAYAAFANGGRRVQPYLIDYVQDRNGETIFKADNRQCRECGRGFSGQESPRLQPGGTQVIDPITAYQISSMLEGVVQRGTATGARGLGRWVAGKTGTTNEYRSAWFVGFTTDIVVGVFIGFDDNRPLGYGETGSTAAVPVFTQFMQTALE
ncbi:hypothetical protein CCR92_20990, partial [Rhodospirillum rubrum]|nr:hypothetical protein [Rhodospirillum rubrum]